MNVDEFLANARRPENTNPSWSWKGQPIGTTLEGTVSTAPRIVETDNDKGGKDVNLVFDVATANGEFALFVTAGKLLASKVAGAVEAAGASKIEVGAYLKVRLADQDASKGKFGNALNVFEVEYKRPAGAVTQAAARDISSLA